MTFPHHVVPGLRVRVSLTAHGRYSRLTLLMDIDVIIPAHNEESAIASVIYDIPRDIVREIVVCDNGSSDTTAQRAIEAGATLVYAPVRGYGTACLTGLQYLKTKTTPPGIVVFLDGDRSDDATQLSTLTDPIVHEGYDLVIGSRVRGKAEKGALTFPQRFGNALAVFLIRVFFKYRFTDLGPFRAIRWDALMCIDMQDRSFGWTVEMQVKAAKQGLRCKEVPVPYRRRTTGRSKISGSLKGSVSAGYWILRTIFKWR